MPHKSNNKQEQVLKMQLTCRSCGWKWYPDPRRWRNKSNTLEERALKCSRCGIVNWVKEKDVERIWRANF